MEQEVKKKKLNLKGIIMIAIQAIIIIVCLVGAIIILVSSRSTKSNPEDFNTKMMVVVTDSMEPTISPKDMIFSKKHKATDETVLDVGTVVTFAVPVGDKFNLITHRIVGYYYFDSSLGSSVKVYGSNELKTFEQFKANTTSNIEFVGYLTRGDKYTLEFGATLDDFTIRNDDGTINYNKDDVYYTYLTNAQVLSTWKGSKSAFLGHLVDYLQAPNHLMLFLVLPIILLIIFNMFLVVREIVNDKKNKAKEDKLHELRAEMALNEEEIKRQAIEEYLRSLQNNEENNSSEEQEESAGEEQIED